MPATEAPIKKTTTTTRVAAGPGGQVLAPPETTKAVTLSDAELNEFMPDHGDSDDVVIGKVLCMQATSKMVTNQEAAFGDFIDSFTKKKLGDLKNPVEILPFLMEKVWVVSVLVGQNYKFEKIEEYTGHEYEYETVNAEGVKRKYEKTYRYFCWSKQSEVPCMIAFKSTSRTAGKKIYTQMFVVNQLGKRLPFANWFTINGEKVSNDKGVFVKLDATLGADASGADIKRCIEWHRMLKKNRAAVKVDESDLHDETLASTDEVAF